VELPLLSVAALLKALREAGDDKAATMLAARAENAGICSELLNRHMGSDIPWTGREPDSTASNPWTWQPMSSEHDPDHPAIEPARPVFPIV
jgi:hypothetical protein